MKRIFFLIIVCGIALSCGISHASVLGTPHDLTQTTGGGGFSWYATFQICVFCHTPHGARTDVSATTYWHESTGKHNHNPGDGSILLWNRALPGDTPGDSTVTGFELYTSASYDSYSGQLNVFTLMCLGCHDGVGAVNVLQVYPKEPGIPPNGPIPDVYSTGISNLGEVYDDTTLPPWGPNIGELTPADTTTMHLANDHPVSINYAIAGDPATGTDKNSFQAPVGGYNAGTYVGNPVVRLFPDPTTGNYNQIECPTCHNVHDETYDKFLVMSNAGSALCTSCHIK